MVEVDGEANSDHSEAELHEATRVSTAIMDLLANAQRKYIRNRKSKARHSGRVRWVTQGEDASPGQRARAASSGPSDNHETEDGE